MSLSRQIALMTTEEQYREAFAAIAKNRIASGVNSGGHFKSILRPIFRALHRGGFDVDKLKSIHRIALQEYHKAAGSHVDVKEAA